MAVDESGSMSPLAADVRGSFNTYIDSLRSDEFKYRLTVARFDHEYRPHAAAAKPKDVPRLDDETYRPRGNTALLDAIGRIVADFEKTTTLAEGDKVMLVVQTDGEENASRIQPRRHPQADRGTPGDRQVVMSVHWRGHRRMAAGEGMGFSAGSTISVAHSTAGTKGSYSGLTGATRSYAAGASGDDAAQHIVDAVS
jgi:hypothetical protein